MDKDTFIHELYFILVSAADEIARLEDENAALLREIAAYQNALGISADLLDDDAADKWEVETWQNN